MSESDRDAEDVRPQREVAHRLFAAEYDDADFSYAESDEERAPNYVVTPSGARVNRLFVVGVLTEVEAVNENMLRARVVDPTGAFVCYAGQYQPDEQTFLERADPPTFVAMSGKARTFQPDDADQVYSSVRPEALNTVDADTRDRWTLQAAEATIERVRTMVAARNLALDGEALEAALEANDVPPFLAAGIPLAMDHYETSQAYLAGLSDLAVEAARLVAGDIDEVGPVDLRPDASGEADFTGHDIPSFELPDEQAAVAADAAASTGDSEEPAGAHAGSTDPETPGEPEFDLDEDERTAIEDEFGTEFQSGTEVDEAGAADIAPPDAEPADSAKKATDDQETAEPDTEDAPRTEAVSTSTVEGESTTDSEPVAGESAPDSEPSAAAEGTAASAGEESAERGESRDDESVPATDEDAHGAETAASEEAAEMDLESIVMAVMEELDDGSGADRDAVIEGAMDRSGSPRADVEDAIQSVLMDGRCYEPDESRLQPI